MEIKKCHVAKYINLFLSELGKGLTLLFSKLFFGDTNAIYWIIFSLRFELPLLSHTKFLNVFLGLFLDFLLSLIGMSAYYFLGFGIWAMLAL